MKVKEVLDKTIQFFRDKKMDQARFEAEWLIGAGLGLDRVQLYMKYDQPLKEQELQNLRDFVKRRVQGEPLAYIAGTKGFYGYDFIVNPDVLIPRPETETLVEKALEFSKALNKGTLEILDLGSGSGCIGLTMAKKLPQAKVTLVDVSEKSLEVAKKNGHNLKVSERCQFVNSDAVEFLKSTEQMFDLILANPPYIAPEDTKVDEHVRKYEPHLALFACQGTSLLETWSQAGVAKLANPGLMLMEMGFEQGPQMKQHFLNLKFFERVEVLKDLSNHDRVILGQKGCVTHG